MCLTVWTSFITFVIFLNNSWTQFHVRCCYVGELPPECDVLHITSYYQSRWYRCFLYCLCYRDRRAQITTATQKTQQEVREHNRKSENTSQRTKELPATRWFCVVLTGFSNCNYFTWKSYKHVTWLRFCWKSNATVRFLHTAVLLRSWRSGLWQ